MTDHLLTFLRDASSWSSFAADLVASFERYGALTPRQEAAAASMRDKCSQRATERTGERKADAIVDLSPIHAMFDTARSNGLSRLCYRAEGLALSPAKEASRNAGGIYVKRLSDGTYLGKVIGQAFQAVRDATEADKAALLTLARDPATAATRYGRQTGTCSCCGRELSDPVSVARGIGPICADRWGL